MRHRDLTLEHLLILRLQTPVGARSICDGFVLTDWYQPAGSSDFVRVAYDRDGLDGFHRSCFTAGYVKRPSDSDNAHWLAILPPGARSGFVPSSKVIDAFRRVDDYLDLYSVCPREYRAELTEKYAGERYDVPLRHPSRPWRLLSWQRRNRVSGEKLRYMNRHVRFWALMEEARAFLPDYRETELLVQRARPGSRCGGACVTVGLDKDVFWSIDLGHGLSSGSAKSEAAAFSLVSKKLLQAGCSVMPYSPNGVDVSVFDL